MPPNGLQAAQQLLQEALALEQAAAADSRSQHSAEPPATEARPSTPTATELPLRTDFTALGAADPLGATRQAVAIPAAPAEFSAAVEPDTATHAEAAPSAAGTAAPAEALPARALAGARARALVAAAAAALRAAVPVRVRPASALVAALPVSKDSSGSGGKGGEFSAGSGRTPGEGYAFEDYEFSSDDESADPAAAEAAPAQAAPLARWLGPLEFWDLATEGAYMSWASAAWQASHPS